MRKRILAEAVRNLWVTMGQMLFRRDIFISYRRSHAPYALKLAEALNSRGLTCFIDEQGIGGGEDIPSSLKLALRKSTMFVLLVSNDVAESTWVPLELEEFSRTRRLIVPVCIGEALERVPLDQQPWSCLKDRNRLFETAAAAREGIPSSHIPEQIDRSFTAPRQRVTATRTLLAAGLLLSGLAVATTVTYMKERKAVAGMRDAVGEQIRSANQRDRAIADREKAVKEKDDAVAKRADALREKGEAIRQRTNALEEKKRETKKALASLIRMQLREVDLRYPRTPTNLRRRARLTQLYGNAKENDLPDLGRAIGIHISRIPTERERRFYLPADPKRFAAVLNRDGSRLALGYSDRVEVRETVGYRLVAAFHTKDLPDRAIGSILWMAADPYRDQILVETEYLSFAENKLAERVMFQDTGNERVYLLGQTKLRVEGNEREIYSLSFRSAQPKLVGLSQEARLWHPYDETRGLIRKWWEDGLRRKNVDRESAMSSPFPGNRGSHDMLAMDTTGDACVLRVVQFVEGMAVAGPPPVHIYAALRTKTGTFELVPKAMFKNGAESISISGQDTLLNEAPNFLPAAMDFKHRVALLRHRLIYFDETHVTKRDTLTLSWDDVTDVRFSEDATRLIVYHKDGSITIHSLKSKSPEHRFLSLDVVNTRLVAPAGDRVYLLRKDGSFEAWNLSAFGPDGWASTRVIPGNRPAAF